MAAPPTANAVPTIVRIPGLARSPVAENGSRKTGTRAINVEATPTGAERSATSDNVTPRNGPKNAPASIARVALRSSVARCGQALPGRKAAINQAADVAHRIWMTLAEIGGMLVERPCLDNT